MALFAKKLEYWASPNSYIAILAIAKKKGGVPISFIVYRYWFCDGRAGYQMRSFFTQEEAGKALFSRLYFFETTAWLNRAGAGGGYEQIPKGIWVRVPVPRIGGRKRKKKPMQIGDLGLRYRIAKNEKEMLESELSSVLHEIWSLKENLDDGAFVKSEVFDELSSEEASLRATVDIAQMKVTNLYCEMEYARSARTGIPLSNSSFTKMLLQRTYDEYVATRA